MIIRWWEVALFCVIALVYYLMLVTVGDAWLTRLLFGEYDKRRLGLKW